MHVLSSRTLKRNIVEQKKELERLVKEREKNCGEWDVVQVLDVCFTDSKNDIESIKSRLQPFSHVWTAVGTYHRA